MTEVRKIHRFALPIDSEWHQIYECGQVLHAEPGRLPNLIKIWGWAASDGALSLPLRVYATGEEVEPGAQYLTTVVDKGLNLVWHIFQKESP